MKRTLLTVFLLVLASFAFGKELSVAAWNVLRLGAGDSKDYAALVSVVSKYDLVGLVEVLKESGLRKLVGRLGPAWSYTISETPVGSRRYKEYYAYVYRKDVVRVDAIGYYPDTGRDFIREPYAARVSTVDGKVSFVFSLVHILYGTNQRGRLAEVKKLPKVWDFLKSRAEGADAIVLAGDFNVGKLDAFSGILAKGAASIVPFEATTLGFRESENSYDHAFASISRALVVVRSGVDRWTADFSTRETVSDHFPIYWIFEYH